jgi:hypothetical protein
MAEPVPAPLELSNVPLNSVLFLVQQVGGKLVAYVAKSSLNGVGIAEHGVVKTNADDQALK